MRLATRTFLWSLLPFTMLLAGSFWAVQSRVLLRVREQLESSVEEAQEAMAKLRLREEQRDRQMLRVVSQNSALKAVVQLMLEDPRDARARRTVEEQLQEIGEDLGLDFLLASDGNGAPLAAVMLQDGSLKPMDLSKERPPTQGYFSSANTTYQVTSVPIDEGSENLGSLAVGQPVDLSAVPGPAVLLRNGRIIATNAPGLPLQAAEASLRSCGATAECEVPLNGETYISAPIEHGTGSDDYLVRSLQSLDAATRPVQALLRRIFIFAGLGALVAAVLVSFLSSRSIVRPIAGVISRLRESAATGELPQFDSRKDRIPEIRDLTESFNRAAAAIRDGQERLQQANVQFIESLASALDARDPYTAGHSRRVSQYACSTAKAMALSPAQIHVIRIGALLHDIGKIGISDTILQKPGRLTPEEDQRIREHPTIGRRILEGVRGFKPYLDVVELHHENWDGTGYPRGLRAEETPLAARLVKIADAWDAMTSDRPYRRGVSRNQALELLRQIAGAQTDPLITEVFCKLWGAEQIGIEQGDESLVRLGEALANSPVEIPLPAPRGEV